ncbi:MAG: hypothetical protein AB7T10_00540 [bacterium]
MKFRMLIIVLLALFVASCSTITPNPDFSVTWLSNNGYAVGSDTSFVIIDELEIQNNAAVETVIYRSTYQYIKNGIIIYDSPTDTFMSMNILLPANKSVGDSIVVGTATIENLPFPLPDEVWDKMVENDWEGVTLRVFLHGKDNYGYNKTCSESFDFGVIAIK